ncbi:MAG: glycerol-3-phosphate acyltransferase [Atopobiaceae bacterium]|nr:glycerol-3-phosphate acyltransferase [Atopobiaceae bacterium]
MLERVCCLIIGYACGCVLFSDIVARAFSGRSAFELGDGNPGMANVGHVLGTKAAICALLGDIVKTVVAVALSNAIFPQLGILATAWAGLGTTLGHDFPFWHGFRGGKGVTTIASTIILMNPLWGITTGIVGLVSIVLTGYLSVAALIAMAFYTVVMFVTKGSEPAVLCVVFMALQVYGHWSKLMGIRNGTTKRAGLADKVRARLRR